MPYVLRISHGRLGDQCADEVCLLELEVMTQDRLAELCGRLAVELQEGELKEAAMALSVGMVRDQVEAVRRRQISLQTSPAAPQGLPRRRA